MSQARQDASLMFRLMTEIHIIAQLSGAMLEQVLPDGLTMPQFGVLNHLARTGGNQTPLVIATAMQVSKGAMTNTLSHLERKGLVGIRPDRSDGRSKRVDITPAGEAIRSLAIAAIEPELAEIHQSLRATEFEPVFATLERLRHVLDERRNPVD